MASLAPTNFAIGEISIRKNGDLFSLNDLHRASGGEPKHQPALFLRLDQTKALVDEIASSTDSQTLKTVIGKGKAQGTYACRELVVAFAAWISAAFHLKVIRVFLSLAGAKPFSVSPGDQLTEEEQVTLRGILQNAAERLPKEKQGKFMIQGWAKLKSHFKVSYRQIPRSEYSAAVNLVARHVSEWKVVDPPGLQDANTAFKLASEIGSVTARAAFNGMMSGNMDWVRGRWLVSLGSDRSLPNVSPIEGDAFVGSIAKFTKMIAAPNGCFPSEKELADLAAACNKLLAERIDYAERMKKRGNSQEPPPLPA